MDEEDAGRQEAAAEAQPPAPAPEPTKEVLKPPPPRAKDMRGSVVETDKKESDGKPEVNAYRDVWTQLLDLKTKEAAERDEDALREATIVFMGPRHSGKSTLIHSYMFKDKEDVPKPTTSLDYKYTRSSVGMSMEKDLSHFWELGGGRSLVTLMDICITAETLPNTFAIITLDLSRPSMVVDDLLYWLDVLRKRIKTCSGQLNQSHSHVPKQLAENAREVFGQDHPDLGQVDLIEIPCMIVANKFDLFKDRDPALLGVMAKVLRVIAHANGCSLLYASKRHKSLIQTFRSRISRHVLNRPPSKTVQFDNTKPLSVPGGADSFEAIGPAEDANGASPVRAWCKVFSKYFPPQDKDREAVVALDELQLAAEPVVDQMLAQKDEDLKQLRRKLQLKRRMKQADQMELKKS